MGFWEKTKGFLLSPSETFNSVKDEDWGGSIGYFAKWQVIYTILMTIIFAATLVWIRGLLLSWAGVYPEIDIAQITWLFDLFAGPMLIGWGVISFISGLIGMLIGSLWMHIWVYVCGGFIHKRFDRHAYWQPLDAHLGLRLRRKKGSWANNKGYGVWQHSYTSIGMDSLRIDNI